MSENQQLVNQYKRRTHIYDEIGGWDFETSKSSQHMELSFYANGIPLDMLATTPIISPPSSPTEHTANMLVHVLEHPSSHALLSLSALGSFFPLIPARLGHNTALDTAIACLCGIYGDFFQSRLVRGSPRDISAGVLRSYTTSLSALQGYVRDSQRRGEAETICASIVLQLCEV